MLKTPDADETGTVVSGRDARRQRLTGALVPAIAADRVDH
jgi:hypothetical protein